MAAVWVSWQVGCRGCFGRGFLDALIRIDDELGFGKMKTLSRFWHLVAGVLGGPLVVAPAFGATPIVLATVTVAEPGELRSFGEGAQVASALTGTGPTTYWKSIPAVLSEATLQHFYLEVDGTKADAVAYGLLDFTVSSDGPVWMLTTSRFGGGGNSSGDWLPEVSLRAELELAGWQFLLGGMVTETGYGAVGTNSGNDLDWLLFERQSLAGEIFSIRTEKYQAPVILQGG